MKNKFREFYESVGTYYPEDTIVYSTLSGLIRKRWIGKKMLSMPRGNMLDCGCNVGTLSRDWRMGDVYGVDIAYSVLERGRTNSPRTTFIQADVCDLSMFKDGSFDNAIACEVIEHIERPNKFLTHLHRAMRRGGRLLVTSPNYTRGRPGSIGLGVLRGFGVSSGTEGDTYLHTAYRPHELAAMASQAGFSILEQGSFEVELRGWLKPLAVAEQLLAGAVVRIAPASRMNILVQRFFDRAEIVLFQTLDIVGLSSVLRKLFKEGRRSYIVAQR